MEVKYLETNEGNTIAYHLQPGKSPGVLFLSGFKSDMTGTKASFLADFCQTHGIQLIRFDYFGHGRSSGQFIDGNLGRYKQDAITVLDKLAGASGPQIVVGSSLGGWLMLILAEERQSLMKGLVGIASAPDFTTRIMHELEMSEQQALREKGIGYLPKRGDDEAIPITQQFIMDGNKHCILDKKLKIHCPMRLLHGLEDMVVPWQTSLKILNCVESKDAQLILIKNADHSLSQPSHLELLGKMILELHSENAEFSR